MIFLVYNVLQLLKWLIVVRAVMSWFVSPHSTHPIAAFIRRVTDWVIRPISELLPKTTLDLAPIAAFLVITIVQQLLIRAI